MAEAEPGDSAPTDLAPLPCAVPVCRRRLYQGRDIGVFFKLHPAARWRLHRHKGLQIVILADTARGLVTWPGPGGSLAKHRISGASVWMVPAGTPHGARLEADTAVVVLLVSARFVRRVTREPIRSVSFEPLEHYLQADEVVSVLGRLFLSYCASRARISGKYVISAGETLAHHLIAAHVTPRTQARGKRRGLAPSAMEAAEDYFNAHLTEGLDLAALARSLQMSVSHFRRLFRLTTGSSPGEHLNALRLRKAEALLASGKHRSVTEVAHAVGCYDHSHLNRLFQRKYGLPASTLLRKRPEP